MRTWIIKMIEKPENAYERISLTKSGLFLTLGDKENKAIKIMLSQYIFVFGNIIYVKFSYYNSKF